MNSLSRPIFIASMFVMAVVAMAQQPGVALPRVTYAELPYYPPGPHTVNLQGAVRIKIRTDGYKVVDTSIEDDGCIVAMSKAAQENVRTWKFADHKPTMFTVIYRYIIDDQIRPVQNNPTIVFRFPTEVEVRIWRWPGTVDVPAQVK
jgi:hypothetical protein